MVGLPDHGLGDALGESLYQYVLAVRDAEYAQVVQQAVRPAGKAQVLPAALEGRPEFPGDLGVDAPILQQQVGQILVKAAFPG